MIKTDLDLWISVESVKSAFYLIKRGLLQPLKKHAMSQKSLKKFNEGWQVFWDNFVMKEPFLNNET